MKKSIGETIGNRDAGFIQRGKKVDAAGVVRVSDNAPADQVDYMG
jgi:hypothetical protein